jgi:outer membrane protein OmpA-like peptidoglycan-associated protein
MKFRIFLIPIISLIMIGTSQKARCQQEDNSPFLRRAIIEYQSFRYTSAIKELTKVMKKEPENLRAKEMMAGSNRNIRNYDEALYWYAELCKRKNIKPEWALYYAEALANKEKYEESEQWYRKYLILKPTDRRAKAISMADMSSFSNNVGEFKVTFSSINTDASEYSPMYYKDGLLFISNRQQKNKYAFQWDRTSYSDMYIVDKLETITGGEPDSVNNESEAVPYLLRGKVRSSYHEGPAVLLPEGSLLFTRNNYIERKTNFRNEGVNKLKLYTASGSNWETITSFPYNNNEYSTGHPTVSQDGKILIFTSNVIGGYGGTDLYYCVRTGEKRKWGRPVNLGSKINTEGNELFPYLDKNGNLYFSSTGHPGLGGMDIFEVVLKDLKAKGTPHNMGSDINSSSDDFGIILDETGKRGFFSSNRRGNDDIYQFTRMAYSVVLKGLAMDANTNKPLNGSKVILRHNGIADTLVTNSKGEFNKILAKETDYELSGSNVSYISRQSHVSTSGITVDSTLNLVLKLNKAENIQQWVIDNCVSLRKMFSLKNIYYNLDRSDIREDAYLTLNEIADIMRKNPEISIITSSHTDSRATESYNRELSLQRGQAARSYLMSVGIDGSRIEVKYYGKSRLLNSCVEGIFCSESEQQINRRTEFEVVINGVNLSQLSCPD